VILAPNPCLGTGAVPARHSIGGIIKRVIRLLQSALGVLTVPLRALPFLGKLSLITLAIIGPLAVTMLTIPAGKPHCHAHGDHGSRTSGHRSPRRYLGLAGPDGRPDPLSQRRRRAIHMCL
jgi:hypothetical protein